MHEAVSLGLLKEKARRKKRGDSLGDFLHRKAMRRSVQEMTKKRKAQKDRNPKLEKKTEEEEEETQGSLRSEKDT